MKPTLPVSAVVDALVANGHESILEEVCRHHGLARDVVCSRQRTRAIAVARHEIFWRLRNVPLTYDQIGAIFGRQHSTIVRGVIAFRRSARGVSLLTGFPAALRPLAKTQATPAYRPELVAPAAQASA